MNRSVRLQADQTFGRRRWGDRQAPRRVLPSPTYAAVRLGRGRVVQRRVRFVARLRDPFRPALFLARADFDPPAPRLRRDLAEALCAEAGARFDVRSAVDWLFFAPDGDRPTPAARARRRGFVRVGSTVFVRPR